jgi:TPR repeat protein
MIMKKTIVVILLACLGSTAQADSSEQIVSLMNAGEFESARKMSLRLITKNDPIALYTLGHLDQRKKTAEGDKSSFNYMLRAANLNHIPSMSRVGFMYLNGIGVKKDLTEGANWLSKASEKGNIPATYNLGLYFYGHYGGEQNPELALEQFLKIINRKELENTEDWIVSAFYVGMLTVNSAEQRGRELSEIAFLEVLKSKLSTQRVNWAKKQIELLVEKGLTKAGRGDGSEDDKLCQNFGFQVLSSEYSQCRLKVEIAKREATDRQREYDLAKLRYEQELARYEQQKNDLERERDRARERRQGEAMLKFGLALMGGTSPHFSENLANAGRQSLGLPPIAPNRPTFQNFTITGPDRRISNCNVFGNNITCN